MKISADLGTFEIVLFKSTMPCIHTYFIVHARRGNENYLWGPRKEEDKEKERQRERDMGKERARSDAAHTFITNEIGQKPERYSDS